MIDNRSGKYMFKRCIINIRKHKLPQIVRQDVWETYIGNAYKAKCFCCETRDITPFYFECGHIVAEINGGKNATCNLLPTCAQCNRSMGKNNYFVFKSKLHNKIHCNISLKESDIIEYYNYYRDNISCQQLLNFTSEWKKLLESSMILKSQNTDSINLQCHCGYKFDLQNKKTNINIFCGNTRCTILDIICDHIPCLINTPDFIGNTKKLKSYNDWKKIR